MLRNEYAHGSTDLHNWALRSFQIVSEIINQLYQRQCEGSGLPAPEAQFPSQVRRLSH
jgi:hypothetical protein